MKLLAVLLIGAGVVSAHVASYPHNRHLAVRQVEAEVLDEEDAADAADVDADAADVDADAVDDNFVNASSLDADALNDILAGANVDDFDVNDFNDFDVNDFDLDDILNDLDLGGLDENDIIAAILGVSDQFGFGNILDANDLFGLGVQEQLELFIAMEQLLQLVLAGVLDVNDAFNFLAGGGIANLGFGDFGLGNVAFNLGDLSGFKKE